MSGGVFAGGAPTRVSDGPATTCTSFAARNRFSGMPAAKPAYEASKNTATKIAGGQSPSSQSAVVSLCGRPAYRTVDLRARRLSYPQSPISNMSNRFYGVPGRAVAEEKLKTPPTAALYRD